MSVERVFEVELLETTTASSTYRFTIPAGTPVPESDDEWYAYIQKDSAAERYMVSTDAYAVDEMEVTNVTDVTPRAIACESTDE